MLKINNYGKDNRMLSKSQCQNINHEIKNIIYDVVERVFLCPISSTSFTSPKKMTDIEIDLLKNMEEGTKPEAEDLDWETNIWNKFILKEFVKYNVQVHNKQVIYKGVNFTEGLRHVQKFYQLSSQDQKHRPLHYEQFFAFGTKSHIKLKNIQTFLDNWEVSTLEKKQMFAEAHQKLVKLVRKQCLSYHGLKKFAQKYGTGYGSGNGEDEAQKRGEKDAILYADELDKLHNDAHGYSIFHSNNSGERNSDTNESSEDSNEISPIKKMKYTHTGHRSSNWNKEERINLLNAVLTYMTNPIEQIRSLGEKDIASNVVPKVTEGRPTESVCTQYYRTGHPSDAKKSMKNWIYEMVQESQDIEWTVESLQENRIQIIRRYEMEYERKT